MKLVAEFKRGDRVPDWLLTAVPLHSSSRFEAQFVFTQPIGVIETESGYVFVPEILPLTDYTLISLEGQRAENVLIGTIEKKLFWATSFWCVNPLDSPNPIPLPRKT